MTETADPHDLDRLADDGCPNAAAVAAGDSIPIAVLMARCVAAYAALLAQLLRREAAIAEARASIIAEAYAAVIATADRAAAAARARLADVAR